MLKLTTADPEKTSKTIPATRLHMGRSLGHIYDQAISVRINFNLNELADFTDSFLVHEELKRKESVAAMRRALGLEPTSAIKMDNHWVVLHEHDIPDDHLMNCKSYLEETRP